MTLFGPSGNIRADPRYQVTRQYPRFLIIPTTQSCNFYIEKMSDLPSVRSDLFKDVKFFLADESNEQVA